MYLGIKEKSYLPCIGTRIYRCTQIDSVSTFYYLSTMFYTGLVNNNSRDGRIICTVYVYIYLEFYFRKSHRATNMNISRYVINLYL